MLLQYKRMLSTKMNVSLGKTNQALTFAWFGAILALVCDAWIV